MYIKDLLIRWIKQYKQPVHLRIGSWGEGVAIRFLKKRICFTSKKYTDGTERRTGCRHAT